VLGAEALVAGDEAAGETGGPAVLVVEPAQHALRSRLLGACADVAHERVAQVVRGETGTGVDMEAAEAHLFQITDLAQQVIPVECGVP
jgi:hypothetical protein